MDLSCTLNSVAFGQLINIPLKQLNSLPWHYKHEIHFAWPIIHAIILLFMATYIYTHIYITDIVKIMHEDYIVLMLKWLGEASL